MSPSTPGSAAPRTRSLIALTVALGIALIGALAVGLLATRGGSHDQQGSLTAAPPAATTTFLPSRFRVSTFNVLGYSHTAPGGDEHKGRLDGRTRQLRANQLIRANNISIVGFQEMEQPQIDTFLKEMGSTYDLFPGNSYTGSFSVNVRGNSIAWRKSDWVALSESYYNAPYYNGYNVPRPLVLLQNVHTGQQVYVSNTHNPANNFKGAQTQRNKAVAIQSKLFSSLRAQHPHTPVIFTGDMNDKKQFFCDITAKSPLRAVSGGVRTATTCTLPPRPWIDWILSTNDVRWSNYQVVRTPYVKATSDHPIYWADAVIAPPLAQSAGLTRAVVLDIEGLPSSVINAASAPGIQSLLTNGAGTLNARIAAEQAAPLPNLMSIITGRPITGAGSHGVTWSADQPRKKNRKLVKVPSLFDAIHDLGGSTSFMSTDPDSNLVLRSYRSGAKDTQGVDYGVSKLTVSSERPSDSAAATVLETQLKTHPRTVSFVQFSSLRVAGEKYGYGSPRYLTVLRKVDRLVRAVVATIKGTTATANSTALIVTADSGGAGRTTKGTSLTQIQVPLIVWGHGVAAGSNLYALNPAFVDPARARRSYSGAQPFRSANVANLVTGLLGYPTLSTPAATGPNVNVLQRP